MRRSRSEARRILHSVSVSVPGKLILAGEHAVVYGRPALVAALDLRLTVTLEARSAGVRRDLRPEGALAPAAPVPLDPLDSEIELDLPGVGHQSATTWEGALAYAREVRERWERYTVSPSPEGFRELRGEDPAHVVKAALGEAATHLAGRPRLHFPLPSCRLRVDSEIPVGSGFGSSAATAIGVLGALFAAAGLGLDTPELESLALEVERRQHGTASGVDGAAALRGGLLWTQRRSEGGLAIERIAGNPDLLSRFHIYHTGSPPEPTGAVVAAVRRRLDLNPGGVGGLLDRIEAATRGLRSEIETRAPAPTASVRRVLAAVRECERCLEALGVVPDPVRELIAEIERQGGAAKISGAGSLAGPGGGSLLVFHPEPQAPASWSFLAPHPCYSVRLGADGLRRESGS